MHLTGDLAPCPGIAAIVDGSEAIAHVETRISEVACAYPITPSTTMAAIFQAAVPAGRPNPWGTPLAFIEPESEHSSAMREDWSRTPAGDPVDFLAFARTEGRFAPHFDVDGRPTPGILDTQRDRLANWRMLQELAAVTESAG